MVFHVNRSADRRIIMIKILSLSIAAFIFLGCSSAPSDKAVEELTSYYKSNDIYGSTYCRSRDINGSTFILCTPDDVSSDYIGGIYQLEYGKDGEYTIFAINGKAMGHIEGSSIAKERYGNDMNVDIEEIRKQFN